MVREFLLIFTLICVTKCKSSSSYSTESLYTILDRTTEYFKNLSNAYDILNVDTNDIDNKIARYMNDMTKTILQKNKLQKRSLQNETEPSKGNQRISNVHKSLRD
ncbi:hypothetical protein P5V15_002200 [Pogonomyrmex californicus]